MQISALGAGASGGRAGNGRGLAGFHARRALDRSARLDGAFFGTTFPHMLFQVYPYYLPARSDEKYVPRIFGFKIHPSAYLLPVQRPPPDGEDIPTVP